LPNPHLNIMLFCHSPERGGPFLRGFYFSKHLSALGHNVSYIVLSDKKNILIPRKEQHDGVNFVVLPSFKSIPFTRDHDYLGTLLGMMLNPSLTLGPVDVIHCLSSSSGITTSPIMFHKIMRIIFKKSKKIKIVAGIDDWWDKPLSALWPFFGYFERLSFRNCDVGIAASEELKARVINHGVSPDKIHYIPDAADIETIRPLPRDRCLKELEMPELLDKRILVHIGRTGGTMHFLQSLKKLVSQKKDIICLLIGSFHEYEIDAINNLGLQENIKMMGVQPYSKLGLYCSAADLLVFPMINNILDAARSPLTLGDYLASGKAIVSNAVGETRRVLLRSGSAVICDVDNVNDFTNAIITLLEDKKLNTKLGQSGRQFAEEKFSWQIMAKKLESIYKL